jgi:hypothetical protein
MTTGKVQKFRSQMKNRNRTSIFKPFAASRSRLTTAQKARGRKGFSNPNLQSLTSDFFAGNYKFGPAAEQTVNHKDACDTSSTTA